MTDMRRIVSENRRAVWIVATALVINAALYVLVVYPLSKRAESGQQEAGDATQALIQARGSFGAARGTVTGKKQADDELKRFYSEVLPTDLSGARRMLHPYVDQLVRDADLTHLTSQSNRETGKTGTLRKLTRTLNLSGEYTNVRQFIHELETAPEFLILESVNVIQGQGQGTDRKLNVTVQIATYYQDSSDGS
jgi:hypothetical protein